MTFDVNIVFIQPDRMRADPGHCCHRDKKQKSLIDISHPTSIQVGPEVSTVICESSWTSYYLLFDIHHLS